jgi:hypothetical protein
MRATLTAIRYNLYKCECAEHNMKPELFLQMLNSTKMYGGSQLTPLAQAHHFHAWYEDSIISNFNFYVVPPSPSVLSFFTDGTICAGGMANTASIASYHGAHFMVDGQVIGVAERSTVGPSSLRHHANIFLLLAV